MLQHELGWDSWNAYGEWSSGVSELGRESKREVVLMSRLRSELVALNPSLPAVALDEALEELSRDRSALSLVEANREIDRLIRGGSTRAAVRIEIEKMLDAGLPEKYTTDLFEKKCGALFQHILEKYPDQGQSVYAEAG